MKHHMTRTIVVASLALAAQAGTAHAQATQHKLSHLPMPPGKGYDAQVSMSTLGQVDQRSFANYSLPRSEDSEDEFNFVYTRYTAPALATLLLWSNFDLAVPDAIRDSDGRWRDSCYHAHVQFAVYVEAANFIMGTGWITAYSWDNSTGKVGRRMLGNTQVPVGTSGARCEVNNQPDVIYPTTQNHFVFGPSVVEFKFHDFPFQKYTGAVLATQGATHGWGGCGRFACFPQVRTFASRVE